MFRRCKAAIALFLLCALPMRAEFVTLDDHVIQWNGMALEWQVTGWSDPNSNLWHIANFYNSPTNVPDVSVNNYYFDRPGPAVLFHAPLGGSNAFASFPDLAPVANHGAMTNRSNSAMNLGTNDYTITFWLRTKTDPSDTLILGGKFASSSYRWNYTPIVNHHPYNWGKSGSDITYILTNSATLPGGFPGINNGDFHFFALVNDRDNTNNCTIYYDGTNASTGAILSGAGVNININAPFTEGQYSTSYNGEHEKMRFVVYRKALSQSEIRAIYNNTGPNDREVIPPKGQSMFPTTHVPADVHIFFGQSNARASVGGSTGLTDAQKSQDGRHKLLYVFDNVDNKARSLQTYGTAAWGAEIVGGYNLYDLSGTNLVFIKVAADGKGLCNNFLPGGDMWTYATNFIPWAMNHMSNYFKWSPRLSSMGFIGCEQDAADETDSQSLSTNIPVFFNAMCNVLSNWDGDCTFYVSRLPVSNGVVYGTYARTNQVLAVTNMVNGGTNAFWIDTDGFGLQGDNVHFDSYGQIRMGAWMSSGVWYRVENHP